MRVPARSALVAVLLGAAFAAAQTSVVCGPTQATCGPAIVGTPNGPPGSTTTTTSVTTTTGATTTTTVAGTALPSWVPSMLAAWMLDEPTGTRVNAQGTTSRDMVVNAGNPTNSTDRMEGAASLNFSIGSMALATTDTFSTLLSPYSVGCWIKAPSVPSSGQFVMHHYNAGTPGVFFLSRLTNGYQFQVYDSAGVLATVASPTTYAATAWAHVVATYISGGTAVLYVNGAQVASGTMTTGTTVAQILYLGNNFNFTGLLDECFITGSTLSAASVCRICSCGIRGEQCGCSGTAYATSGRNAAACGSCALPACNAATPP